MSRLLEMADEKVQQRKITVTTYRAGSCKAVIEGRLVDQRFRDVFLITGERRPVGMVHDMVLRLLIDTASMTIEDLEVELAVVPRAECTEVRESVSCLKGMRIERGFTKKMKSLLGGSRSCTHLRELLEAVVSAVFQGIFTILAEDDQSMRLLMKEPRMMEYFMNSALDSCHVWRKEGPEFKRVMDLLAAESGRS
ncbi:MAG TPA: DUF2889 domain-containing protein [Desulfomonilia bacterium]|nr:DUF2889 domain-containing protein [Desulfomonilia bacterium]